MGNISNFEPAIGFIAFWGIYLGVAIFFHVLATGSAT